MRRKKKEEPRFKRKATEFYVYTIDTVQDDPCFRIGVVGEDRSIVLYHSEIPTLISHLKDIAR